MARRLAALLLLAACAEPPPPPRAPQHDQVWTPAPTSRLPEYQQPRAGLRFGSPYAVSNGSSAAEGNAWARSGGAAPSNFGALTPVRR